MKRSKKALILILIALATFVGSEFYFTNNFPINYFSPYSASSTVYIENGVSGIVSIKDPFLNKEVEFYVNYYPLEAGSGVIVTKNGYIITAFHVVSDPQTLNNRKMLKKMDDSDIKRYVEQAAVKAYLSSYNPQLSSKLLNNTVPGQLNLNGNTSAVTELLVQNGLISVKSYRQVIKVKFPASDGINPLNAQLVDVGDSNSDDDIALLKVNPVKKNLPTLNISLQKPAIGENIRIYGYPVNSYKMQNLSSVAPLTSTGRLTAETPNSLGTIYYKTNSETSHGYSGGPVLNAQNEVIGILIYGVESRGHFIQQIESRSSLFLSSKYIIQICNKNNVPINIV